MNRTMPIDYSRAFREILVQRYEDLDKSLHNCSSEGMTEKSLGMIETCLDILEEAGGLDKALSNPRVKQLCEKYFSAKVSGVNARRVLSEIPSYQAKD